FSAVASRRALHSFPTRRSSDLQGEEGVNGDGPFLFFAERCLGWKAARLFPGGEDRRQEQNRPNPAQGVVDPVPAAGKEYPDEKRSEEHTSELQSRENLVCRLLL